MIVSSFGIFYVYKELDMSNLKISFTDPIIIVSILLGLCVLGFVVFLMIRRDKKTKALLESQAEKRNGRLISGTLSSSGKDLEIPFKGNKIIVGFNKGDTSNSYSFQGMIISYSMGPSDKLIDIFPRLLRRNSLKGENIQDDTGTNDTVFDKVFSISTSDPDLAQLFLDVDVRQKILDLKHKIINIMVIGRGLKINYNHILPCAEEELDTLMDFGIYLINHLDKVQANI